MYGEISKLRVALVTDWMTSPGGADRLLLSLLKLLPNTTVFTSIYSPENYVGDFKIDAEVKTTFLQKFPFKKQLSRHYNLLAPFAFESLDLRGYDLVISLSAGPAKGVITGLNQKHIGIILTPPRYLWDSDRNVRGSRLRRLYRGLSPFVATYLRLWDSAAAKRVDHLVSISQFIAKKVEKTYRRESEVIYPGVSDFWFETVSQKMDLAIPQQKYFLVVSRLYDYKRVDWAIKACVKNRKRLIVAGSGPDCKYLKKLAPPEFVTFLSGQSDEEIRKLYINAQALLFCGVEDFGLVPVEAMAAGCPVLAMNEGGVTETVERGLSGEFFSTLSEFETLTSGFDRSIYKEENIKGSAMRFTERQFIENFTAYIEKIHEKV